MKTTTWLGAMILAATFAGPANAVYKCTTSKGVIYQDRPCREGSETDVRIVIPTGEMAPRNQVAQDDEPRSNTARSESSVGPAKAAQIAGDASLSLRKPLDRQASSTAASTKPSDTAAGRTGTEQQARDTAKSVDNSNATIAEQARKAEPSAKYYSTDGFAGASETPAHMTCESATGEKRVFFLSNGKLTSI